MRLPVSVAAPRPLAWVAAFLAGSLFGLSLRLAGFLAGALFVRGLGELIDWLAPLMSSLDPIYTHAAGRSLADLLGGAVYAWTRNGPEGVDRNFGLTDDGVPVDGNSLDMLSSLFHAE